MQFQTLVRHFFERFFDKDSISPQGDERANVVQIVAMLAVPGAIISLFMVADHAMVRSELTRMWLRAGDRFVFVAYAMVVMGFVMTFKWDSLFPDRRDYLILAPLPLTLKEFFAAKVVALIGFLLVFIVAINFFSTIIVPYVYLARTNHLGGVWPMFVAHATAAAGGSAFMALFFAALQGVLINLMTPAVFRRVSPWIQMISMAALVTVLLFTPGVSANIQTLTESDAWLLDYIPLFWFFGVYEVLHPEGTLIPAASTWAVMAVLALFVVGGVFLAGYLVSYRRYARKILEGIESDVFDQSRYQRMRSWLLNRTLLGHPFQRASFYFIGRILGRSAKHRLFISMYGGIGLAVTLSSLFVFRRDPEFRIAISPAGLMEAPLIASFFVISGLRATFNIPYELAANWMFQITSGRDAEEFMKATRKWVLLQAVIPAFALLAPLEFMFFDAGDAVLHLAFGLVVASVLTELFFFEFNKVPFTCSYLPARSHLAFLAAAYLYGFTVYAYTMARLERWVSASGVRIGGFFAVVLLGYAALSWYRRAHTFTPALIYEDNGDPLVRQLNLT